MSRVALITATVVLLIPSVAHAAGFQLVRDAWGAVGGGATGAGIRLGFTVGQPASGLSESATIREVAGFWHGAAAPVVGADSEVPPTPLAFSFEIRGRNPFSGRTSLRYVIPSGAPPLAIRVFDIAGRMVRVLESGSRTPGAHVTVWDGRREDGTPLGSGVYLVRMDAGAFRSTRRLILIR